MNDSQKRLETELSYSQNRVATAGPEHISKMDDLELLGLLARRRPDWSVIVDFYKTMTRRNTTTVSGQIDAGEFIEFSQGPQNSEHYKRPFKYRELFEAGFKSYSSPDFQKLMIDAITILATKGPNFPTLYVNRRQPPLQGAQNPMAVLRLKGWLFLVWEQTEEAIIFNWLERGGKVIGSLKK